MAELRPALTRGLSSHSKISKKDLLEEIRTTENPQRTYSLGDVRFAANSSAVTSLQELQPPVLSPGEKCVHIEFNREHMAWHYGWKSNKWHQDVTHLMDVVLLEDKGEDDLFIVASFLSNEFAIASTKYCRPKRSISMTPKYKKKNKITANTSVACRPSCHDPDTEHCGSEEKEEIFHEFLNDRISKSSMKKGDRGYDADSPITTRYKPGSPVTLPEEDTEVILNFVRDINSSHSKRRCSDRLETDEYSELKLIEDFPVAPTVIEL